MVERGRLKVDSLCVLVFGSTFCKLGDEVRRECDASPLAGARIQETTLSLAGLMCISTLVVFPPTHHVGLHNGREKFILAHKLTKSWLVV